MPRLVPILSSFCSYFVHHFIWLFRAHSPLQSDLHIHGHVHSPVSGVFVMDHGDGSSYTDDSGSLTAQGTELALPPARVSNMASPELGGVPGYGLQDQQDDILERLANHYSPIEGYDSLVKAFEKSHQGTVRASFRDGIRLAEVADDAVRPKIGITFLAGADTPQVNQMEQIQMSQREPDQKDASWRVNTAGTLLRNLDVDKDMSITFTDVTPSVVASVRRRQSAEGPFIESSSAGSKAVAIRHAHDRIVTIDSKHVKMVNDLASEKWDLEGLLVEVDQSSLMSLIFNYRQIIHRGGANLPCAETVSLPCRRSLLHLVLGFGLTSAKIKLLDMMIEDARRLCVRSPILFRMSTRRHIISSTNTRYGVDHGTMFQTFTTSSGIKNIISLSAAYFNSLASYSSEDQQLIRARFLQMLVLLLSLLNDDDLHELAEFLEVTYGIQAERYHIELLILKVLPLMSINSKIFLKALVTALDGPLVNPSPHLSDQPSIWNFFLRRLLEEQYILPGTLEQVGSDDCSWQVRWPPNGFKDSSIFKNIQYAGSARSINEIPPINLSAEVGSTEATATFTNGCKYIVSNADLENIIRMIPKKYSVTEASPEGRSFDLDITDVSVNDALYRAIWEVNSGLTLVKSILPTRPKNQVIARLNSIIGDSPFVGRRLSGKRYQDDSPLPELKGSGRLTYHVATLNGQMLAVAYKVEGRKITRRELVRHLASDLGKMRATIQAVEATVQQTFEERKVNEHVRQTVYRVRQIIDKVEALYRSAEDSKERMEKFSPQLRDEPIVKVLYPIGSDESPVSVWNDYKAWYVAGENVLFVDAQRRFVQRVSWVDENVLEVSFHGHDTKYFVTPLRKLEEHEKEDELKVDDRVILCGQYLVVVELSGQSVVPPASNVGDEEEQQHHQQHQQRYGPGPQARIGPGGVRQLQNASPSSSQPQQLEMVLNWLKITGVETPRRRRRHPQLDEGRIFRSAIR